MTDPTRQRLDLEGYQNEPLPHTFYRQEDGAEHLAILFPGMGYTVAMPALWYPHSLLLDRGADVLAVQQNYTLLPAFAEAGATEREEWAFADGLAAYGAARAQRDYQHITLVGKSLGTLVMARLVAEEPALKVDSAVWLTPLLKRDNLRRQIAQWGGPSLFAIGTEDPQYRPELLAEVERATGSRSVVIERADHSLEIPGDVLGSIGEMERLIRTMAEFMSSVVSATMRQERPHG